MASFTNVLSPSDIAYIQQLPEVVEARSRVDAKSSGMIYFTITLTDSIRSALVTRFGLDLTTVHTIPMRWVKGDTAPHVDVGSATFDHTHLVYLSDSAGALVIDGAEYPIQENTGYIFAEGISHATYNTGATPRLVLGPMSNQAFAVGDFYRIRYHSGYPTTIENVIARNTADYELGIVTDGTIGSYTEWKVDPSGSHGTFDPTLVYSNGHIFDSADGLFYYSVYPVTKWVAVGWGTTPETNILWSPDGKTWNNASSGGFDNGGGGYYGNGIAYGNGQWVAVGDGTSPETTLLWSPDGKTWNDASSGGFLQENEVNTYSGIGIAYGGSKWVAVGNGNTPETSIKWSLNGKDWHDASSGGFDDAGGNDGRGIAYGNGQWVAVGSGTTPENSILWSPDGKIWHDASSGGFDDGGGGYYADGIAYGNGQWVAVGYGTTPENSILWSPDGRTWHDASSGGFDSGGVNDGRGIAYDNGKWVAVGDGTSSETSILWSPDGRTWHDASSGGFDNDDGSYRGRGVASTRNLAPPPPPAVPCFVLGTRILTPTGYKAVEELQSGDYVLTAEKRRVPIKLFSFTIANATAETAPYRIQAGTFGRNLPKKDLHLSARHAVQDAKGRWQMPKYLAKFRSTVTQYGIGTSVTYYHIECPNYYRDNLVAEEVVVESFNNKQSVGATYMWSKALGGWERLPPGKMTQIPKNPTSCIIFSY